MATCLNSINLSGSKPELRSGVLSNIDISSTLNTIFTLDNVLSQSVFFNIRVLTNTGAISISLTIYNTQTLAIFGSLNITSEIINTSFTIPAGKYYICVRSVLSPYNLNITPSFISYDNTATFAESMYFGYSSMADIKFVGKEKTCNRRLYYTMIDGALPIGLSLLDNGNVYGNLPILDCDEFNKDLPSSSSWYQQIPESEKVTPWGRAYRFKVRIAIFDDMSVYDESWFYISLLNDFSKNKMILDMYEVLADEKITTFEDRIKLTELNLCPNNVCSNGNSNDTNTTENDLPTYEIDKYGSMYVSPSNNTINLYSESSVLCDNTNSSIVSNIDNITDLPGTLCDADPCSSANTNSTDDGFLFARQAALGNTQDNSLLFARQGDISPNTNNNEPVKNILAENTFLFARQGDSLIIDPVEAENSIYKNVELNVIDEQPNIMSYDTGFESPETQDIELIPIDVKDISFIGLVPSFDNYNNDLNGLVDYYIDNFFDLSNVFVTKLKDSCMFQTYLVENNVSSDYIYDYAVERFTYTGISIEYDILDEIHFVKMKNTVENNNSIDSDPNKLLALMQDEEYVKLPISPMSHVGFYSYVNLIS